MDCERRHVEPWLRSLHRNLSMDDYANTMDDSSLGLQPFRNVLHLTDFSSCSEAAFTWAAGLARANNAELSVLHVLVPDMLTRLTPDSSSAAFALQEKWAQWGMRRIEAELVDFPHRTIIAHGDDVCSVVEARQKELGSDLIVMGTHGRTGFRKVLMGSVAEGVLRASAVPVLSVGPGAPHDHGKFHRVLLATDFSPGSPEVARYAASVAQRDQAELVLVHACKKGKAKGLDRGWELSVAEVLHRMDRTIACAESLQSRPEMLVEFGEPGEQIVEVAKRRKADLIVMGIRKPWNRFAATHLRAGTAHTVVAQAPCPVLTVRPRISQAA